MKSETGFLLSQRAQLHVFYVSPNWNNIRVKKIFIKWEMALGSCNYKQDIRIAASKKLNISSQVKRVGALPDWINREILRTSITHPKQSTTTFQVGVNTLG